MQSFESKVIQWATDHKIMQNATAETQMLKCVSEVGELADALIKNDQNAVRLELGDVLVTLCLVSAKRGLSLAECLGAAYDKIKDRTGTMMPNGVFVKD